MNINAQLAALKGRLNTKLGKAIAAVLLAALILRFPWIVTSWAPQALADSVMQAADMVTKVGAWAVLLFAKQFNETGSGAPATTPTNDPKP